MNPCPKIINFRSKRFLAFIRTKPSLKSGLYGIRNDPTVAAHQNFGKGGKAIKAPDIQAVPLLDSEHKEEHRGTRTFWGDQYEALPLRMLEYINEFLSLGNKF